MTFLYLLSFLSIFLQGIFITLAIAAGLYYLAELIEEYTVTAKRIITWIILSTVGIHLCLILFEDLPLHLNVTGLLAQALYASLMRDFPSVAMTSIPFVLAIIVLCVHNYLAFSFFGNVFYSLQEVLTYFIVCLWLVPLALFVSLTANDYVLPTTSGERQPLLGDNNVLTDYLSRKAKRYNLLRFFSFAKESLLPQRTKKAF